MEEHNSWDTCKRYQLDEVEQTAGVTAVTWTERYNWVQAVLPVNADLTGTIDKKSGIALSGMSNPLLNGSFNVDEVTATTVTVNVAPKNQDNGNARHHDLRNGRHRRRKTPTDPHRCAARL